MSALALENIQTFKLLEEETQQNLSPASRSNMEPVPELAPNPTQQA